MPRDLFGKISSLDLGSPIPPSLIMVFNLIVKPSEGTVATWKLRIDILLRFILKGMDRPKLLIMS